MRQFILEVIIFTLITMVCISVFGQNWQDENHVWNEEKGEWEVENKAGGRVLPENGPLSKMLDNEARPYYGELWEKYLPKVVRQGKREATPRELSEAQRKLWAKNVRIQRAMQESQRRRNVIAHRKATGWYGARRAGNHQGLSWPMQMHMQSVSSRYGSY